MYCHNDEGHWQACKTIFREIILFQGILETEGSVRMDQYYWSDTVETLLSERKDDELALHIMHEIIRLCAGYRLVSKWDMYLRNTIGILMSKYFSTVWPALKIALLSENEDYDIYFSLKDLVGSKGKQRGRRKISLTSRLGPNFFTA